MADPTLPICNACGSEHASNPPPSNCKICDDPRQFVPGVGQTWTTLEEARKDRKNVIERVPGDDHLWTISTAPKLGIGQRAFLIETPDGLVMWDMIAFLDQATIDFINAKGGLRCIAISHPHYYTTHAHWAAAFQCPLIMAAEDSAWLTNPPPRALAHLYDFWAAPQGSHRALAAGLTLVKAGGHFPGSLLLHYRAALFIADTIVTVPSAYTPHPRPPGQTSYVYQWSIPNMIPLPPAEIYKVWASIRALDITATHGAFAGMHVRGSDVRERLLESAKIQVRGEGWEGKEGVAILEETL